MDDYYELLAVPPDAGRDDIRGAYRAKRDELQAVEGDQNRSKIAELNRAWNVLSDPTQRERYDERLAEHRETGEDDDEYDDDDEDDTNNSKKNDRSRSRDNRPVPVTKAQRREAARAARGSRQNTLVLGTGVVQTTVRKRLTALATDVAILIMIFLAVYISGLHQVSNHYPGQQHRASVLTTQEKKVNARISADKKKVSAADKQGAAGKAAGDAARAAQKKDQAADDVLVKQIDAINRKLAPGLKLVYALGVLAVFLYLVPSTAISGETLGKHTQKIRIAHYDGSVPGWKTALLRYGVPLLVGLLLGVAFLGFLGLGIALIGMIGWVTHPNQQGMHDRLAKTVVIDA